MSGENSSSSTVTIKLPNIIMEKLKNIGVDIEALIVDLIIDNLDLKLEKELEVHKELAKKFLDEGRGLINIKSSVPPHSVDT